MAAEPLQVIKSPSYPNNQLSTLYTVGVANEGMPYMPDLSMDVSANNVVSGTNTNAGTRINVYTKSLIELSGSPFQLSSLAGSSIPCNSAVGQPQILYDTFANIWLLSELASDLQTICLYASLTGSPLVTSWTLYPLYFGNLGPVNSTTIGRFKLANFNPDYYTMSVLVNGTTSRLVFINRVLILPETHSISTQFFSVVPALPDLVGMDVSAWSPLDNRGIYASPLDGAFFMRQRDNSLDPGAPLPVQDYLDIVQYTNVSFLSGTADAYSYSIPLQNFDTSGPPNCIPVPITNVTLYAAQEWLGGRLGFSVLAPLSTGAPLNQLRVVGAFVTGACTTGAQIQWFELAWNNITALFNLRQQGLSPGAILSTGAQLWLPSIVQDKYGNMLLSYSNSSAGHPNPIYPSLGSFGRTADDPLNTMRYNLGSLTWATGAFPSPSILSNWGYSQVSAADHAQPVGRTFYSIGAFSPGTSDAWRGQIAGIRMAGEIIERVYSALDNCGQTASCTITILVGNS